MDSYERIGIAPMYNNSVIQFLEELKGNQLFIKREDLIPFSFGGNKARKSQLFFEEIDAGGYNYVVTYGSGSSNHCRVVANECSRRGLPCLIIRPKEESSPTYNSHMIQLLGAKAITVPVDEVHDTIEKECSALTDEGYTPFFIPGGGHGKKGTEAYVRCYNEIKQQEKGLGIFFDYIFFASGTGTTQAGLICGQLLSSDDRKIIGISIARKNPRGRNIVLESVRDYLGTQVSEERIKEATIFLDEFTTGYGKDGNAKTIILYAMRKYGIPFDATYTGKAFMGMQRFIEKKNITGKNILFIHTGGTPLFFDTISLQREET